MLLIFPQGCLRPSQHGGWLPPESESQNSFHDLASKVSLFHFQNILLFTLVNDHQYRKGLHKGMNTWIQENWRLEAGNHNKCMYVCIYWKLCVYTNTSKFNPTPQDPSQLVLSMIVRMLTPIVPIEFQYIYLFDQPLYMKSTSWPWAYSQDTTYRCPY